MLCGVALKFKQFLTINLHIISFWLVARTGCWLCSFRVISDRTPTHGWVVRLCKASSPLTTRSLIRSRLARLQKRKVESSMVDEGGAHLKYLSMFARRIAMTIVVAFVSALFIVPGHTRSSAPPFNHFSTGFALTGSHASLSCASCHVPGRSQSIPRTCFDCHNGQTASGKSQNHTLTSNRCGECHQTTFWADLRLIQHAEIPSATPCSACHNGAIAIGKATIHIPTVAPCQMCHTSTASFAIGAKLDHTGITSGCATCHNSTAALGKPNNHIPTNLPCETCHSSTVTFPGATLAHAGRHQLRHLP